MHRWWGMSHAGERPAAQKTGLKTAALSSLGLLAYFGLDTGWQKRVTRRACIPRNTRRRMDFRPIDTPGDFFVLFNQKREREGAFYPRALMISMNSGFKLAPPTKNPSTSFCPASSLQFFPVTEPVRDVMGEKCQDLNRSAIRGKIAHPSGSQSNPFHCRLWTTCYVNTFLSRYVESLFGPTRELYP